MKKLIDREASVDLHAYFGYTDRPPPPPPSPPPAGLTGGSAVTDGRLSSFLADRWAQGPILVQPENRFSMPLCAATAILLSCQSQTAWLTLSVVPRLNSGVLLRPAAG